MKITSRILSLLLTLTLLAFSAAGLFAVPANAVGAWVTSWASSLVSGSISLGVADFQDVILAGSTLRTVLTVTTGGSQLSFMFSNQYGASDITINQASVAKATSADKRSIVDGTQTPITFNGGETSVTIPAGQRIQSDYIKFNTAMLDSLAISTYFEDFTYMTSVGLSNGRTYMRRPLLNRDSQVNNTSFTASSEVNIGSGAITYHTIPFLERIDTYTDDSYARTAVFIGDSTLVNDTYLYYARRLASAGVRNVGVVNEAIIGNKLLSDGSGIIGNLYGQALIDRFSRDVLKLNNVKYCFVKIGLNDILHQFSKTLAETTPKHTTAQIIAGYRSLINMCHSRNIKIYFFTKSAWMGYERNFLGSGVDITWTQQEQDMCDELTKWIKSNNEADGYIDCAPLADPSDPRKLCSSFTPDGAHLTDLGAIAMADLIPLEYVGAKTSAGKTAALLTGTNPYAEKNEILARMEAATAVPTQPQPTYTEPTASYTDDTTVYYEPEGTTAAPATTAAPETTTAVPSAAESYTVDHSQANTEPSYYYEATGNNQEANYSVPDNTPGNVQESATVGNGTSIAFIMVFAVAVVAAVTLVTLTMMKKKDTI